MFNLRKKNDRKNQINKVESLYLKKVFDGQNENQVSLKYDDGNKNENLYNCLSKGNKVKNKNNTISEFIGNKKIIKVEDDGKEFYLNEKDYKPLFIVIYNDMNKISEIKLFDDNGYFVNKVIEFKNNQLSREVSYDNYHKKPIAEKFYDANDKVYLIKKYSFKGEERKLDYMLRFKEFKGEYLKKPIIYHKYKELYEDYYSYLKENKCEKLYVYDEESEKWNEY